VVDVAKQRSKATEFGSSELVLWAVVMGTVALAGGEMVVVKQTYGV
jgi:hypothetical protein